MKLALTTPMTAASEPRLLAWDGEFWGIRIAQTDHPDVDGWALANTVGCMCLLADPDDPAAIQEAEDRGYRFTDVRVELERESAYFAETTPIRSCLLRDVASLAALARRAHRITRFYADPRFDRERCDDLYEGWFRNSVAGWAQAVLVVGGDEPIGYVTVHLDNGVASIGLIAVREDERGHGYGLALTRAAVSWAHAQGVERITVVTQARNAAALATFQRAGFTLRSTRLWLHRWSETP